MRNAIIILACALLSGACHHGQNISGDEASLQVQVSGDSVRIPAGSPVGKKIKLITVTAGNIDMPYVTTGTVKAIPECIAEIAVPFAGRVVESFVKAGQQVRAGSPLFSLNSPEYMETVKAYLQARQEKQVAELNMKRQLDLVDHGVGVQKELDEARLNFEIAKGQVDNLRKTLAVYNTDEQQLELGKPLVVTSPIRGEVVKSTIQVGQYFKADSDPMVCVADLKKIRVVAQVKENRIGWVSNQDQVELTLDAYPNRKFSGIVSYISRILDEQTRSLDVIIEVENQDEAFRPGMFATVRFVHEDPEGLLIPATAIMQGENQAYVYRQTGTDRFVRTGVTVSSAVDGRVMVLSGLQLGDTIIAEGSIYLH